MASPTSKPGSVIDAESNSLQFGESKNTAASNSIVSKDLLSSQDVDPAFTKKLKLLNDVRLHESHLRCTAANVTKLPGN